jgi:hypothetical protein
MKVALSQVKELTNLVKDQQHRMAQVLFFPAVLVLAVSLAFASASSDAYV